MLSRREFVTGAAGALSFAAAPATALGRPTGTRRFVLIVQRGAADGLSMLAPLGDPLFRSTRGALADDFADAAPLDGMFALHPALRNLSRLYRGGQALFAHAVALSRPSTSHFEAQHRLESGGISAYERQDSWLNRLAGLIDGDPADSISMIAASSASATGGGAGASCALPLIAAPTYDRWFPEEPACRFVPGLAGVETLAVAAGASEVDNRIAGARAGAFVARRLSTADRPRIAMVETDGWDTHHDQRARVGNLLHKLDGMIGALEAGLGALWRDTVVVVATEFGRAVRPNETGGTEHGAGSAAVLFGGAVRGGRVIADWPGLPRSAVDDGTGLRATLKLERVLGGAAAATLALDPVLAMRTMFPTVRESVLEGLVVG